MEKDILKIIDTHSHLYKGMLVITEGKRELVKSIVDYIHTLSSNTSNDIVKNSELCAYGTVLSIIDRLQE